MTERVFFLGAGFSKAIAPSFPLLRELSEYVSTSMECKNPVIGKTHLPELFEKIPVEIKNNVEDLLMYLSSNFPWKDEAKVSADRALFYETVDTISEYFLNNQNIRINNFSLWKGFSNKIASSYEFCFISLNYDVLLEKILYENLLPYFYKFYSYPILDIRTRFEPDITIKDDTRSTKLIKLHGSANWFYSGVTPSDTIYCYPWNEKYNMAQRAGLKPFIVPPVSDKSGFYNHIALKHLWKEASFEVSMADEIYIIGYSFPQSDASIRFFFQEALQNVPFSDDPKIFVVNKARRSELEKNYNLVFPQNLIDVNYEYCGDENCVERFIREKILEEKK